MAAVSSSAYETMNADELYGDRETAKKDECDTIGKMVDRLRMQEERLARLTHLEHQFQETRDLTLLAPFADIRERPKVALKTDIGGPVALYDHVRSNNPEELRLQNEDIKRLFPEIEIREVETIDGKRLMAYIGIDCNDVSGALRLCREERRLADEITRGTEQLNKAIETSPATCASDREHESLSVSPRNTPGFSKAGGVQERR